MWCVCGAKRHWFGCSVCVHASDDQDCSGTGRVGLACRIVWKVMQRTLALKGVYDKRHWRLSGGVTWQEQHGKKMILSSGMHHMEEFLGI